MLVIEIALGIVLAVLLLRFWRFFLTAAAILAGVALTVAAIAAVMFIVAAGLNSSGLMYVATLLLLGIFAMGLIAATVEIMRP